MSYKPRILLKSWLTINLSHNEILDVASDESIEYLTKHRKHFVFISHKADFFIQQLSLCRYTQCLQRENLKQTSKN